MMNTIIERPTIKVKTTPTIVLFSSVVASLNPDYRLKKGKSIRGLFFLFAVILMLSVPRAGHAFCFEEAGGMYGVSPRLLWAIAKVESDFNPEAVNRNKNGSYDVGLMQINSWWKERLGDDLWESLKHPCQNVKVGAWVLAQCIERFGRTWKGIGCYNAASDSKRAAYAEKVMAVLRRFSEVK